MYDEDKLYDTVDVLVEIADEHEVSPARVALAWLLGALRSTHGSLERRLIEPRVSIGR